MNLSRFGENLKDQNSELYFVEVKQPAEIRRLILESLKEILEVLQQFEKFKHLRHDKLNKIQKLRGLLREANRMFGFLKNKLPQTNLKASIVKESQVPQSKKVHPKATSKSKPAEEKTHKSEKTELERLEDELGAIESKLKNLN